jgi:hypothetical protein
MDVTRNLRHVRIDAWLNPLPHNPMENQSNRDVFLRTALFNEQLNAVSKAYGLYIKNTMGTEYAIDYTRVMDNDLALEVAIRMRSALIPATLAVFPEVDCRLPVAV